MGVRLLMTWVRYVFLAAAFTAVMYSGDITIPLDGGSIVVENPQSDMAAESSCQDVQENVAKKAEEQPTGQVAADTAQDQRAKAAAKAARRHFTRHFHFTPGTLSLTGSVLRSSTWGTAFSGARSGPAWQPTHTRCSPRRAQNQPF